ncbi:MULTISPECIES: 2-dehydropantoate 2-reductase [Acidiphilium]|uniref:2-dehydropantoate 2-reductase n=1 Tax=Acidiphilium TaxID=522 RepID=UPI00257A3992|nr:MULTISPECIES: 2-dehydropantoate 2-reductase [Acidiphilium]HQT83947.1 2-dehydropantoate 2-reductase [Acidiphilium rubrum]
MAMKILVVGAGSIGGYFGGRLTEAGADVTFLVRPARATALRRTGLVIKSARGDYHHKSPKLVDAASLTADFDLILLSCKAYDLAGAIADFAPAVGPDTLILPLLNGISHLDDLDRAFGAARVLGGQCVISTVLDPEGRIIHLNEIESLTFGARDPGQAQRVNTIAAVFGTARFATQRSDTIMQDMWEKFAFITSLAGITCLMRATIGDIVAAGGDTIALALAGECAAIAASQGYTLREPARQRTSTALTAPGSPLAASMLRDIERSGRIEADHILGTMLARCPPGAAAPVLRIAYVHVKSYEAGRAHMIERAPG